MSNAIEIEAKVLVSKEDYEKLRDEFKHYGEYYQTNFYIDTADSLLRKEGIALRVREKWGLFEMTLKTPLATGLLEKNCAWSRKTFEEFTEKHIFPEGDIKRFLTMLDVDVDKLFVKTSLTTKRIDVPYMGGKLSIDKNAYSGRMDYEVELEANNMNEAETNLKKLLDEKGIPFVLNKKPKIARALATYEEDEKE